LMTAPAFAGWASSTILDAVTATGASATIDAQNWVNKTFYIIASSVTTGGTVTIETSADGTNWAVIGTVTVDGNGTDEVAVTGMFHRYVRANVATRTDGTYTVIVILGQ